MKLGEWNTSFSIPSLTKTAERVEDGRSCQIINKDRTRRGERVGDGRKDGKGQLEEVERRKTLEKTGQ